MKTYRWWSNAAARWLFLAGLAGAACAASAADPSQFSEAERQLFVRPHLAAVALPARLHYRYQRSGDLEPEVTDHAVLSIATKFGARTADVEYLSAERKLELPPTTDVEGNPIILHFLEREVRELKRLTGGSIGFYRSRIRKALAGDASVRQVEVDHDGRMLKAVEIRIEPFVNDPARSRFEEFADRYYVMVLSPDIPGEVYQLKAALPGRAEGAAGGEAGEKATAPATGQATGQSSRSVAHAEVLTFERQESGH